MAWIIIILQRKTKLLKSCVAKTEVDFLRETPEQREEILVVF